MRDLAAASGTGLSTISQTVSGSYPPPKSQEILDRWASALELSENDRTRFFLLADLSRSPLAVQELVDVDQAMERLTGIDTTTPAPHNYFGERLAAHLEAGGRQIPQAAKAAEISVERLQRIIDGYEPPTAELAKTLARTLGLDTIDALEFTQLAAIALAPPEARPEFKQVLDILIESTRKAEAARRELTGE